MSQLKAWIVGNFEENLDALVAIHQLCSAQDAIRHSLSAAHRLQCDDGPVAAAARHYHWCAGFSALGEVVKKLRGGEFQTAFEAIEPPLDRRSDELGEVFQLVTRQPPDEFLKFYMRIRDKLWAHSDADLARSFISTLRGTKGDPVFAETTDTTFQGSAFGWPQHVFNREIERFAAREPSEPVEFIARLVEHSWPIVRFLGEVSFEAVNALGLDLVLDELPGET